MDRLKLCELVRNYLGNRIENELRYGFPLEDSTSAGILTGQEEEIKCMFSNNGEDVLLVLDTVIVYIIDNYH